MTYNQVGQILKSCPSRFLKANKVWCPKSRVEEVIGVEEGEILSNGNEKDIGNEEESLKIYIDNSMDLLG